MKRVLLASLFITTLTSTGFGQGINWPFAFSKPNCSNMPNAGSNCTKWVVTNNGNWNSGSTWNGGTVPGHMDIVCIPAGMTVQVNNPTYTDGGNTCPVANTALTPTLYVFVCGTIDFKAGGKLHTGCGTNFTVFTGGRILAANGNSELIAIAPTGTVWGGSSNTDLVGPTFLSGTGQGPVPVPVMLDKFNADNKVPGQVRLSWLTYQEINSLEFVIERSADLNSWEVLGSVGAAGNSGSIKNYSFTDVRPLNASAVFYRLRQVDEDGKFGYSGVVRVSTKAKVKLLLFPNPVVNTVNVQLGEGIQRNQQIQIFSTQGRLMKTITPTSGNLVQISVEGMPAGSYFLRLVENGATLEQVAFIKQ